MVNDTKASLEQRNAARRELDASLKNIHKAMRLQKDYDRATVENVVSLCKMMVKSYSRIGKWRKKNGLEGASVLDASSECFFKVVLIYNKVLLLPKKELLDILPPCNSLNPLNS